MAIALDDGEYYEVDSAVLQTPPHTVSLWLRAPDVTNHHISFSITDKDDTDDIWGIFARGDVAGDPLEFNVRSLRLETGNGYTANTWHHALVRESSATDHRIMLDGNLGDEGSSTSSVVLATANRTSIGRFGDGSPLDNNGVDLAEINVWNVGLNDAEGVALSKGYSPLLIRPASRTFYVSAIKAGTTLEDIIGGLSLAKTGTPIDLEHPRMIYPSHNIIMPFAAAAPAVGNRLLTINPPGVDGGFGLGISL